MVKPETIQEDVGGGTLEDYLGYHLRRSSILDMTDFVRHFADANLKPVPFAVLCLIDETPGITAAEIGRKAALQRANLAPLLAGTSFSRMRITRPRVLARKRRLDRRRADARRRRGSDRRRSPKPAKSKSATPRSAPSSSA